MLDAAIQARAKQDQHAMEQLLHVSTERVVIIATAAIHTLVLKLSSELKSRTIVTDG